MPAKSIYLSDERYAYVTKHVDNFSAFISEVIDERMKRGPEIIQHQIDERQEQITRLEKELIIAKAIRKEQDDKITWEDELITAVINKPNSQWTDIVEHTPHGQKNIRKDYDMTTADYIHRVLRVKVEAARTEASA